MGSLGSVSPSILSLVLKSVESTQCESTGKNMCPQVGLKVHLNGAAAKWILVIQILLWIRPFGSSLSMQYVIISSSQFAISTLFMQIVLKYI